MKNKQPNLLLAFLLTVLILRLAAGKLLVFLNKVIKETYEKLLSSAKK